MLDGLIPYRYAMALYKYAEKKGITVEVYDEMTRVAAAFTKNPELSKALSNPFVKNDDKKRLLLAASGKHVDENYQAFVNLVLNHKREMYFHLMALSYRKIYRKANNISSVKITTAVAFNEKEQEKLQNLVSNLYKDRTLEFEVSVNPEIIGGFIVDVDNNRLDASVSNEFAQLRQNLISNK